MFKVTTALTLRPDSSGVICRTLPFTSRREGDLYALVLVGAVSCLYIILFSTDSLSFLSYIYNDNTITSPELRF